MKPVAPLFILLGKTNMKAKRFENAVSSFERAIKIMVCDSSSLLPPSRMYASCEVNIFIRNKPLAFAQEFLDFL